MNDRIAGDGDDDVLRRDGRSDTFALARRGDGNGVDDFGNGADLLDFTAFHRNFANSQRRRRTLLAACS